MSECECVKPVGVGDKAPDFSLLNNEEQMVKSEDFAGKKYILYFYPKDSTPGCTLEAQGFRNRAQDFGKLGYTILGVSRDSVKSHQKFCEAQSLNFQLLSDKEEQLCLAYDVIKLKPFCGKMCRKVERSTFVIDNGVITHALRDVKAKTHVEELYALLSGE